MRCLTKFVAALAAVSLFAGCSQNLGSPESSPDDAATSMRSEPVASPIAPASALPPVPASPQMEEAASQALSRSAPSHKPSETLGTQWGEGISSSVTTVDLRRISSQPLDVLEVRYSAAGYRGKAIREVQLDRGRIGLSILDENNRKWQFTKNGRNYHLRGRNGARYQLFYRNYSRNTYEIVATVDGLDVLNGSPGSFANIGYVLNPGGTLVIEGFRKSEHEVAAFRFSAPGDAYAANSEAGSPRNVGVIGTAVFELRDPRRPAPATGPNAFPGDGDGFAPPPNYRR